MEAILGLNRCGRSGLLIDLVSRRVAVDGVGAGLLHRLVEVIVAHVLVGVLGLTRDMWHSNRGWWLGRVCMCGRRVVEFVFGDGCRMPVVNRTLFQIVHDVVSVVCVLVCSGKKYIYVLCGGSASSKISLLVPLLL